MPHPLESSVLRILGPGGKTVGAGFVIAPGLAVTCAHVVTDSAKSAPGQSLQVELYSARLALTAAVMQEGWSPGDQDDLAFLRLADCPEELQAALLADSGRRMGRGCAAFGFPSVPHWALGRLKEPVQVAENRRPLLEFEGGEIAPGMSGGPLMDDGTGQVVGMVCEYRPIGKTLSAYAVTAETIAAHSPQPLQLASSKAPMPGKSPAWFERILEALRDQSGALEVINQSFQSDIYFQLEDSQGSLAVSSTIIQELLAQARRNDTARQREEIYLTELLINTTRARWEREYLPLSGSLNPPRLQSTMRLNDHSDPGMSAAGEKLIDLRDALIQRKKTRLVILGEPGCGKTTTLERLTLDLARRRLNDPAHEKLPLPIDLFDFNKTPPDPTEFLRGEWRKTGLACDFDEMVLGGELCFLLDGVNQMPFDDRADRVSRWNAWAKKLPADNWAVFTCRSLDYQTSLELPEVHVQQLAAEDIQRYLELRLGSDPKELERIQGEFEIRLNSGDHRFKDLARNIFMLSLLVERALEGSSLTANRADLMADLVERRLFTELSGGRQPDWLLSDQNETIAAAFETLSRLGYAMQEARGATVLEKADALLALGQSSQTLLDSDDALRLGVGSGLLEMKKEKDRPISISFYHHLLQEFFAGQELLRRFRAGQVKRSYWQVAWRAPLELQDLLRRPPERQKLPPLPVTGWEETTRMAAAQAGKDLERLVQEVARWNLPLAGRCLSEAVLVEGELPDRMRAALLARQRSRRAHLPARIDAGLALGELGHPELTARPYTFEGKIVYAVCPPMQPVHAGPFLIGSAPEDKEANLNEITTQRTLSLPGFSIGRYPVTNAEYRFFLEAGGYDRKDWWDQAGWDWRQGGPEAHAGPIRRWLNYRLWLQQGSNLEDTARKYAWTDTRTAFWQEMIALSEEDAQRRAARVFSRPFDRPAYWDDPTLNAPTRPVVGVNWFEARAYSCWLSRVTGLSFDLPAEAAWEKAARGEQGRTYPWRGKFDPRRCNTLESGIGMPSPVGLFADGASPLGVLDPAGNVWEWTASFYQAYPGADPAGSSAYGETYRVLRGGSWNFNRWDARCAYRVRSVPDYFNLSIGFRIFSPGLFLPSAS